mmetsp:Transcript_21954/g.32006  ORF Transcript_21954/g.32006 Transcript_21954/m.32006 type:complete len:280 (+) Transcript_21954:433-1272(+)
MSRVLDDVWHDVIGISITPSKLDCHIRLHKIITGEKSGCKACFIMYRHKEPQQVLRSVCITRLGSCVDSIFIHAVLFRELYTLRIAFVLLVNVCGNTTEFQQFMLLDLLGKINLIKVIKIINRRAKTLVILLGDVELIEGLVNSSQILLLYTLEILTCQSDGIILAEQVHDTSMVEVRSEDLKQSRKLKWVLLDIKSNGPIMDFWIANFGNAIQEQVLTESHAMVNHRLDGSIVLTILLVQEDSLIPEQRFLAGFQQLHHITTTPEYLDVFHQLGGLVL